MQVPKGLFILWAICLIGIVIGFGKSEDAFTIAGYHIWKVVGIACAVVAVVGLGWLFAKSSGK